MFTSKQLLIQVRMASCSLICSPCADSFISKTLNASRKGLRKLVKSFKLSGIKEHDAVEKGVSAFPIIFD